MAAHLPGGVVRVCRQALLAVFLPMWSLPAAFAEVPPEAADDRRRALELIRLSRRLPIFDKMNFAVNHFSLLEDQERLEAELARMGFVLPARERFLRIEIRPFSESERTVFQLRPEALESWRAGLLAELPDAASGSALTESAVRVKSAIEGLKGVTFTNLYTGLVQLLPPEKKGEFFRLAAPEEKLERIAAEMPDGLPAAFLEKNGFPPGASRQQVLEKLADLHRAERKLAKSTELFVFLETTPGGAELSVAEARERISRLSVEDFERFNDRTLIDPAIEKLKTRLKAEGQFFRENEFRDAVIQDLKAVASRTKEVVQKAGRELRLEEVGPDLAIFRGCAGGDCSTSKSFPFPNDPLEKVFLVRDGSGAVKGYVEGTLVRSGGKPAFYLNTINGPYISADEAVSILHAFSDEKLKSRLGVAEILTPRQKAIDGLGNYEVLKGVFSELARRARAVPLEYPSAKLRTKIEKFKSEYHSLDYDHMKSNSTAVPLQKAALPPLPGGISLEVAEVADAAGHAPITDEEIVKTLVKIPFQDLSTSERRFFERFARALGRDAGDFLRFHQALLNPEALPTSQFLSRIRETARTRFHLELPEDSEWLRIGRLVARDAAEPGRERAFLDELERLLAKGIGAAGSLNLSGPEESAERVRKHLGRILRDRPEAFEGRRDLVAHLLRASVPSYKELGRTLLVRPEWLGSADLFLEALASAHKPAELAEFLSREFLMKAPWPGSPEGIRLAVELAKRDLIGTPSGSFRKTPGLDLLRSGPWKAQPGASTLLASLLEALERSPGSAMDAIRALEKDPDWVKRIARLRSACPMTSGAGPYVKCLAAQARQAAASVKNVATGSREIGGKAWFKKWHAAGRPEDAPELKGLAEFIRKSAQDGVIARKLELSDLVWNGENWALVPGKATKEGLTVEKVLSKYRKKLPTELFDSCARHFERIAVE
ncbi:MAG: hypothetical protein NDJ89_10285 [Oligoflexia bacterium]|nr:hypothetical protein [Oligoflexia bacterium]